MATPMRLRSPVFSRSLNSTSETDSIARNDSAVDLEVGREELTRAVPPMSWVRRQDQSVSFGAALNLLTQIPLHEPPPPLQVDGADGASQVEMTELSAHGQATGNTPQEQQERTPSKQSSNPWRIILEISILLLVLGLTIAPCVRVSVAEIRRQAINPFETFVWALVQFLSLYLPLVHFVMTGVQASYTHLSEDRRRVAVAIGALGLAVAIGVPTTLLWERVYSDLLAAARS